MSNLNLTTKEVNKIKEIFERVHNNTKLSDIERDYLSMKWLCITNTWSDVILHTWDYHDRDRKDLVSIPYFTIWCNTYAEWKKVEADFLKLSSKSNISSLKETSLNNNFKL